MPKIQCGEAEYRIVGDNGEEGPEMAYGLGNTMEADNGDLWAAHVDVDGEDDSPVTKLAGGYWLHNLTDGTKLKDVECEEVQFEGDEDEEEGDDDDAISDDEDEDEESGDDEDEIEELKVEEDKEN